MTIHVENVQYHILSVQLLVCGISIR